MHGQQNIKICIMQYFVTNYELVKQCTKFISNWLRNVMAFEMRTCNVQWEHVTYVY